MPTPLPDTVKPYAKSPVFTEETVPQKLTRAHDTKPGVWGRLVVMNGALDFVIPGPPSTRHRINKGGIAIIEPTVMHYVVIDGAVTFEIEFLK